jgi:hypothetical protein
MKEFQRSRAIGTVCGILIPQSVRTVTNNLRRQEDGSYISFLGGGAKLRLVKIGGMFAVTDEDLAEFLRAAGVRVDQPTEMPSAPKQRNVSRRGRPRNAIAAPRGTA